MRLPLLDLFHLSNLLHMISDLRIVDVEFFSIFSCSSKWISFDDPLNRLLSTSDGWPLLIFKTLVSFAKLVEPPLHYMFLSSSWAKRVVADGQWSKLSPLLYDPF